MIATGDNFLSQFIKESTRNVPHNGEWSDTEWRDMIVKVDGVPGHLRFDLHDVDSNVY